MSYALCAAGVMMVGTLVSAKMSSDASDEAAGRAISQNTYEGTLQQALKKQEAEAMIKASKEQADKILGSARQMRSSQMAQSAASGVLVGEGSSQVMQDRTTELSMEDALAAMYSGARGSVQANTAGDFAMQQAGARSNAAAAQNASNQRAIGVSTTTSLLSTAVGAYGSYKKANPDTTTK